MEVLFEMCSVLMKETRVKNRRNRKVTTNKCVAGYELTPLNWQPCLLASFVVSAKTSFDEPVWNEDFVREWLLHEPIEKVLKVLRN